MCHFLLIVSKNAQAYLSRWQQSIFFPSSGKSLHEHQAKFMRQRPVAEHINSQKFVTNECAKKVVVKIKS